VTGEGVDGGDNGLAGLAVLGVETGLCVDTALCTATTETGLGAVCTDTRVVDVVDVDVLVTCSAATSLSRSSAGLLPGAPNAAPAPNATERVTPPETIFHLFGTTISHSYPWSAIKLTPRS